MDPLEFAILIAVCTLDIVLGIVVLQRNHRRRSHILFSAAAFSLVVYMVVNFMCDQPRFYSEALLLNRLAISTSLLMGVPLVAFAVVFPKDLAHLPRTWMALLAPLLVLAALGISSPLLVAAVEIESWGTNIIQGRLFPVMVVYGILVVACLTVSSLRSYRSASAKQRAQFKYLYLGLGAYLGSSILIGAILPMLTGTNELARLIPLTTLCFLVPTAYAIIKHRLMDVQFVVLRAVAYTGLLALAGSAIFVLARMVESEFSRWYGIDSHAVILLIGFGAAVLFTLSVRWLEKATDRVFLRRTYDPDLLLNELGSAMSSTIDERQLASVLSNQLARTMRLSFAAVAFRRADRSEIVSTGAAPDADVLLQVAQRLRGEAMVTDTADTGSSDAASLVEQDVRVLLPLLADDAVLGAIALGPKSSGTIFSERDLRVLSVLASEAAISMKNALLFDEKTQRVRELTALNELAFALGSTRELDALLQAALDQVVAVTHADTGSILLLEEDGDHLCIAAAVGIPAEIVGNTHIPLGEGIAGWVAECREPLVLVDDDDPRFAGELLREEIGSAVCAPVISRDEVIGVLNVSRKGGSEQFTDENLHVVTSFAGQLGIAIENARLYTNLESTFLGTISALAAAVDAKDPYTYGHSNEVTIHAVRIAEELGLDADEVQMIRIAATLHDIGKIGIDGAILLKPGRLTAEEREIINRHPAIGADILAPLDFLKETVPLVLFHHERYGGGGYPSGISGEAIPFGARIISVADSFNAMVSDRPYREGLSLEAAMRELRENSGSQFDPVVVDAFLKLMAEGAVSRRPEVPIAPSTSWSLDEGTFRSA